VVLDAGGEAVFERLRTWRAQRAAGKPAYTVFSDETLRLIAAALPSSDVELRRIKGIGPTKLELYGDDVLALTSDLRE
jgi:superfamily II DNA helicase RecQ